MEGLCFDLGIIRPPTCSSYLHPLSILPYLPFSCLQSVGSATCVVDSYGVVASIQPCNDFIYAHQDRHRLLHSDSGTERSTDYRVRWNRPHCNRHSSMTDGQGLRVLTGSDIDQILARLDLNKAISSQAAVFSAFSSSASGSAGSSSAPGDDVSPSIQNPHRTTIDSLHATSLFMPARVAELGVMTCKIVSVPKSQSEGGLPAVTAVLDDRGRVKGLVNARRLTAMRNACGKPILPAVMRPAIKN